MQWLCTFCKVQSSYYIWQCTVMSHTQAQHIYHSIFSHSVFQCGCRCFPLLFLFSFLLFTFSGQMSVAPYVFLFKSHKLLCEININQTEEDEATTKSHNRKTEESKLSYPDWTNSLFKQAVTAESFACLPVSTTWAHVFEQLRASMFVMTSATMLFKDSEFVLSNRQYTHPNESKLWMLLNSSHTSLFGLFVLNGVIKRTCWARCRTMELTLHVLRYSS